MSHLDTESAHHEAVEPERQLQTEPAISAGAGVPGLSAATGFATEVFTSLLYGLMVIPLELPIAMGFNPFQAVNWSAAQRNSARPR